MTCELQWDIKAQAFKGIAQFTYAEDPSNLPFDEHGFYYGVKYGFDGVVTERYYALQPGDIFVNEDAEDPDRITTFKSITRRTVTPTDFYISYRSRPFTYLDNHPEIQVDSRLLAAANGLGIRYNAESKETLVYYVHAVDPRCRMLIEGTDDAAYLREDADFLKFTQEQAAALTEFKSAAGVSFHGFGITHLAEIIIVPGIYRYVAFWNNDILKDYLNFWEGEYALPGQIFNV